MEKSSKVANCKKGVTKEIFKKNKYVCKSRLLKSGCATFYFFNI